MNAAVNTLKIGGNHISNGFERTKPLTNHLKPRKPRNREIDAVSRFGLDDQHYGKKGVWHTFICWLSRQGQRDKETGVVGIYIGTRFRTLSHPFYLKNKVGFGLPSSHAYPYDGIPTRIYITWHTNTNLDSCLSFMFHNLRLRLVTSGSTSTLSMACIPITCGHLQTNQPQARTPSGSKEFFCSDLSLISILYPKEDIHLRTPFISKVLDQNPFFSTCEWPFL